MRFEIKELIFYKSDVLFLDEEGEGGASNCAEED